MHNKNYFAIVGKKEVIYKLVEELQNMQTNISVLVKQLEQKEVTLTADGLADMRNIVWICYRRLFQCWMEQSIFGREHRLIKKKVLTAATVRTCGNKRKPLLPMYSQLEYSRGSS